MSTEPTDTLTDDERATFQNLRRSTDDEDVQKLCELVLQSDSEEANS